MVNYRKINNISREVTISAIVVIIFLVSLYLVSQVIWFPAKVIYENWPPVNADNIKPILEKQPEIQHFLKRYPESALGITDTTLDEIHFQYFVENDDNDSSLFLTGKIRNWNQEHAEPWIEFEMFCEKKNSETVQHYPSNEIIVNIEKNSCFES